MQRKCLRGVVASMIASNVDGPWFNSRVNQIFLIEFSILFCCCFLNVNFIDNKIADYYCDYQMRPISNHAQNC